MLLLFFLFEVYRKEDKEGDKNVAQGKVTTPLGKRKVPPAPKDRQKKIKGNKDDARR